MSHLQLRIGVLLAAVLLAELCLAQDWPGSGPGNSSLPPVAPAGPAVRAPVVPGPPMQPMATSRPAAWPGSAPSEASAWVPPAQRSAQPASGPNAPAVAELKPFERTQIVARVGAEAILESDLVVRKYNSKDKCYEVVGAANELIEANKDRIPPDQLDKQRDMLKQQLLKGIIENKLICQDAKRTIPSEAWTHIEPQLGKAFDDDELPKMMKNAGMSTSREFDKKLRTLGSSLEHEKRAFAERALAQQWVLQQTKHDEDPPTYDQMVTYYRQHQDEFTTPARARYEELAVNYSKYPTKDAARDAIARMGNQVWGGAPFANVAQTGSDGVSAADGGQRDWTSKGALVCAALDQSLFSLPVGQLSPIVEGPAAFYIIRVTAREDVAVRPFLEAQVDIKEKISKQRSKKLLDEFMAKLETRTPVWTMFDGPAGAETASGPRPLSR
jgi:parvulin-like peptidyl-prolyl isomerase